MGEASAPSSHVPSGQGELDKRRFDRLRWHCRRGMLELDVVLQDFLQQQYATLTARELELLDKLLVTPDNILWAYVQGSENPPDNELMQIVSKIKK